MHSILFEQGVQWNEALRGVDQSLEALTTMPCTTALTLQA